MLDECKGDKFEEMLVNFSTLVLRKRLQSKRRTLATPLSQTIGIMENIKPSDSRNLVPLVLAHRASLTVKIQSRAEDKALFDAFHDAVRDEHIQLQQQHDDTVSAQRCLKFDLSPEVVTAVRNEVQRNWAGPVEGSRLLLDGFAAGSSSMAKEVSYMEALDSFRQTKRLPSPIKEDNLLERLEASLKEQNRRLAQWNEYGSLIKTTSQKSLNPEGSREVVNAATTTSSDNTIFTEHQGLCIGSGPPKDQVPLSDDLEGEYGTVITAMKRDLSQVAERRRRNGLPSGSGQTSQSTAPNTAKSLQSSTTPKVSHFGRVPLLRATSQQSKNDLFSPLKDANYLPESPSYREAVEDTPHYANLMQKAPEPEFSSDRAEQMQSTGSLPLHVPRDVDQDESPTSSAGSGAAVEESDNSFQHHETENHSSPSDDQAPSFSSLATANASRYTLDERARMSIALSNADDSGLLPSTSTSSPDTRQPLPPTSDPPKIDRRTSLADRTRQAMNFAQSDLKRRQSKREKPQSSYPVNQFETPVKRAGTDMLVGKDTTPQDKLFSEDAEYASVFKSRPKIAASPILSPIGDDELTSSFIHDEEEFGSSPLKAFGSGVKWDR